MKVEELETATLVLPDGAGRCPAIVFLHWGFGSRATFRAEAEVLAGAGVVSLLAEAPGYGLRPGGVPRLDQTGPAEAFAKQLLAELTADVELLCARPDVDADRIGYVGFSLGASVAGAFLSSEPRVQAAVVMGGYAELSKGWLLKPVDGYAAALSPFDNAACIGRTRAALFFQYGLHDKLVALADGEALFAAAREPKRLERYDASHAFDAKARADRVGWLGERLGFSAPETSAVTLPLGERVKFAIGERLYVTFVKR